MIGTHQVCLRPVGAGTTLPSDYIIHIPHEQAMVFGITADSFRCCCRTGIDGIRAPTPPLPETFIGTGRGSQKNGDVRKDVIVKVADDGDDQAAEQLAVTDEVLSSLDCEGIPQLVVYNKCDTANLLSFDPDILLTSAKTGVGLPTLLAKIDDVLAHRVRGIEVLLPYDKLALADILRSRGSVAEEEYREDGVYYRATVKIDDLHRFEPYLV